MIKAVCAKIEFAAVEVGVQALLRVLYASKINRFLTPWGHDNEIVQDGRRLQIAPVKKFALFLGQDASKLNQLYTSMHGNLLHIYHQEEFRRFNRRHLPHAGHCALNVSRIMKVDAGVMSGSTRNSEFLHLPAHVHSTGPKGTSLTCCT